MLSKLITDLCSSTDIKDMISKHDIVSYYLFLTFDELTKNLVMRYYANNLPTQATFNTVFADSHIKSVHSFEGIRMLNKQKD